jgi:hypothetical protein
MKTIGSNMKIIHRIKMKEVYILQKCDKNTAIHINFLKIDGSYLMFLRPIHDSIISKSKMIKEIFKKSLDPNVIWLLFEFEGLDVGEVLVELFREV